jgi:hypothetical protein
VLFYLIFKSGLWRTFDREKLCFFFGWTPPGTLSRQSPLWRHIPWGRALFSPRQAQGIMAWLRYRIELFDGQAG